MQGSDTKQQKSTTDHGNDDEKPNAWVPLILASGSTMMVGLPGVLPLGLALVGASLAVALAWRVFLAYRLAERRPIGLLLSALILASMTLASGGAAALYWNDYKSYQECQSEALTPTARAECKKLLPGDVGSRSFFGN